MIQLGCPNIDMVRKETTLPETAKTPWCFYIAEFSFVRFRFWLHVDFAPN